MGIDGSGFVSTSSPVTPGGQTAPSGSNASTAQPRWRAAISPARTGSTGAQPTNPVQMSVPPHTEAVGTPSVAVIQRNPSAGSGDPVEPTHRRAPRSGVSPAFRQLMTNDADVPKPVIPTSAARSHRRASDGYAGSPSKSTTVAPVSSPDTT